MPQPDIRSVLLQVIADNAPQRQGDGSLQAGSVLEETRQRLGGSRNFAVEEAILTVFHDLMRTGYLAWGFNLANSGPPWFHITEQGRKSLANLSRDPSNPDGYFRFLSTVATLEPVAESYLREAVACFVQDLPKAAAVMVGGASESMALGIKDEITKRQTELKRQIPKGLEDWKFKVVLDAMYAFLDQQAAKMPRDLKESFKSYWPAFLQQIRTARNEAGHPSSVEPVTLDTVHASLLIFPELARLTQQIRDWLANEYK